MKAGKILLGIISGAAAGAVAGMLFAPKKGTDTRQKISDKSNQYVTGAKNKYNEYMGKASGKYDNLKSKASRKTKKMEEKVNAELEGNDKIIY